MYSCDCVWLRRSAKTPLWRWKVKRISTWSVRFLVGHVVSAFRESASLPHENSANFVAVIFTTRRRYAPRYLWSSWFCEIQIFWLCCSFYFMIFSFFSFDNFTCTCLLRLQHLDKRFDDFCFFSFRYRAWMRFAAWFLSMIQRNQINSIAFGLHFFFMQGRLSFWRIFSM